MTRYFSIFGDSISTFKGTQPQGWRVYYEGEQLDETGVKSLADTWWSQVIELFDGELLANASWSGSIVEGQIYPAGASERRIKALGEDGRAPDDILTFIGINDYGWGCADAQIAAGSAAAPPELVSGRTNHANAIAGMAPKGSLKRFADSYELMLSRMHEIWPGARIWAATLPAGRVKGSALPTFPRHFRGIGIDEYNKAIADAVTRVSAAYLVDMATFGLDYETTDGTHPTRLGMSQIAALYQQGMLQNSAAAYCQNNSTYTASDKPLTGAEANLPLAACNLFDEFMRSSEFCTEPCVGCPFARSTGNSWFHICERQLSIQRITD